MKKSIFTPLFLLFTLCLVSASVAFAEGEAARETVVTGIVKDLDETAKTFVVVNPQGEKTMVEVTNETTFDLEKAKNVDASTDTTFKGLAHNDMVKVEGLEANGKMTAKHVEVYRE